ncbi:MAG: hypothetical protein Q9182_001220 [Xanthomendoza sp. 2 TL-2023]
MADLSYGCNLCWDNRSLGLGQVDDCWMFCESEAATVAETSSDGAFEHVQPAADSCSDCTNQCRDLESPLDQTDLEHFRLQTAELVAGIGCSSNARADCKSTVRRWSISPLLDQRSLVAIYQGLEDRLADLEESLEELYKSYDLEILEIRNQLKQIAESITSDRTQPQSSSPSPWDVSIEADEVAYELDSLELNKQVAALEASPLERYVQKWHAGGLIIVENLSDHARMRDIHDLFNSFGTITYLELHGPDKPRTHIRTRHAYIHFAEYNQALKAHQNLHGHCFQKQVLMVLLHSTSTVRGEPGKPYVGSALEVLNFAGGSNYASPGADYLQDANEDLTQLLKLLAASGPSTYLIHCSQISQKSLPRLPGDGQACLDNDAAMLEQIEPLPMRQAGAYVPPALRKPKANALADTDETNSSRPHPAMKILKRGEPLPSESFKSGMVHSAGPDSKRLDIEDFLHKGKKNLSQSRYAAIDDVSDDEEGGVLLP